MKPKAFSLIILVSFLLAIPTMALAMTEIVWWHAHTGFLGERVNDIVNKFNSSQTEYAVKALHKGSYAETLTSGIAAYRAKTHPQIIQVINKYLFDELGFVCCGQRTVSSRWRHFYRFSLG